MVFGPLVFDDFVIGGNSYDGVVAYSKLFGSKKWVYEVQGGVSNPGIAVGNYVFFSTYTGEAVALNATTGKLFWSTNIIYPTTKAFVFENGRIYIHTQNDEILCLEASTGEKLWSYRKSGSQKIQIGGTNPPLILGALIISGFSDGSIVALEKNGGQERWERRLNFKTRFRDLNALLLFDKDKILVSGYDDHIYALQGFDGAILWKKEIAVTSNFALVDEKSVCAGTLEDKLFCLNPLNGEVTKTYPTASPVGQITPQDGKLFYGLSGGGVSALDIASGQMYTYPTAAGVSARLILDKNSKTLFFSSNRGNLYSIKYHF